MADSEVYENLGEPVFQSKKTTVTNLDYLATSMRRDMMTRFIILVVLFAFVFCLYWVVMGFDPFSLTKSGYVSPIFAHRFAHTYVFAWIALACAIGALALCLLSLGICLGNMTCLKILVKVSLRPRVYTRECHPLVTNFQWFYRAPETGMRTASKVNFYMSHVLIRGGNEPVLKYENIYKVFLQDNLLVLRYRNNQEPCDLIIDLSQIKGGTAGDLVNFVDARIVEGATRYDRAMTTEERRLNKGNKSMHDTWDLGYSFMN